MEDAAELAVELLNGNSIAENTLTKLVPYLPLGTSLGTVADTCLL